MATPLRPPAAPAARPSGSSRKSNPSAGRPVLESLEQRLLLSASLVGVPDWFEQGPRPIVGAQLAVPPDNLAGGAVQAIAVNPTDATNIFIATVNGGVWQTTNADPNNPSIITWTTTTDQFESLAASSVAFSPLDPAGDTVYAGTGMFSNGFDGDDPIGLLRTTDGGATWELLGNDVFGDGVLRIKEVVATGIDLDPGAGVEEVILVATIDGTGRTGSRNPAAHGGGIYRSEDNGETWTLIAGGSTGLATDAVTQLIGDPNDVNTFYAGIPGEGVFRSGDGGETWDPVNTGLTSVAGSSQIEVAAHDDGGSTVLYAGISTGSTLNGVWRSTNDGGLWTALAAPPAGFSAGSNFHEKFNMVADPVANDVVYISGQGGSNINWRYNPAGAGSWVLIEAAGTLSGSRPHADSRDLEFLSDTVLLESDDGGIYFIKNPTNAAANDWQSFVGDLGAIEFWQIAYDSKNNVLTGGSQDNGSEGQTTAGSLDWTWFRGGDGYAQDIDSTSADAGANVFRYAMSNNINTLSRTTYDNTNAKIGGPTQVGLRSSFAAADLSGLNGADAGTSGFVLTPFTLNTVDPRMLLVGRNGLYEDNDTAGANGLAGDVIVEITANLPGGGSGTVFSMVYGGVRGGVGYTNGAIVGTSSGRVYFRGETGTAFTQELATGSRIDDIAVDPNDYRRVFVVSGNEVWMTEDITDTGSNPFTDVTGNMGLLVPNLELRSVAYVPGSAGKPDTLVVGGMGGVFRTVFAPSRFGTWTELGAELPNALAWDLVYNATDDVLAVGTFGRGAWTIANASDLVSAESRLQITGTAGDDTIVLQRDPGNPSLLNVFINSFTPTDTFQLSTIGLIDVSTLSGLDTLIVDNSEGMIAPPNGIRYDGGDEPDLLQVEAGDETDAVYDVGPGIGQGVVTVSAAAATQTIYFQELEPVQIVGGGAGTTLTVNGTASDNAVNYAEGPNSDDIGHLLFAGDLTGFVTVDNFESIEFSNYETLVLNGGSGSDVIHLNNPTTPTTLADITVNGDDDTVGDTLIVNGTAVTVDVDVSGETITGTSGSGMSVAVAYGTVEALTVVAGSSSSELAVSGSSDYTVNPGAATDRGTILSAGIPIEYQGYGAGDALALDGGGSLVVTGTAANDVFTVAATYGDVTIAGRAIIERAGTTADLVLNGLDGDDLFDVTGSQPYTTILLAGGNPSASDVAALTGSGANVSADLAAGEVTGGGLGTVSLTGIEQLDIDAATGNLTVLTGGDDDTVEVTPLGTNHGTLQANGAAPVVNFSGVGDLTVNLLGGNDLLTVNASSGEDTITVDGTTVAITGRQAVDYLGTESVIANGLAGSDTFDVTPSASVSLFVDGGQPIAVTPGDKLIVQTGGDPVELNMGPESDEGSFAVAAKEPISFDHMESFSILGGGPLVINGTNGPDAITVVARDDSTHGGADGVQDFTVAINASPEFLFLDVASVTVNALGGSDEIVLRTPAPNDADWDTDVTVNGGPPSASDRLVVETPGAAAETATYTPTASDAGTLVIAEATPADATNVTITGIEELAYDGEADDDALTVAGTGGADTVVHTPGASDDAGTLQVNTTLALAYQNLGSSATVLVDGGAGADEIVVHGTSGGDAFSVDTSTPGGRIDLNSRLPALTANIQTATLEGHEGDDAFTLVPAISGSPYTTLNLNGGDEASALGDVANVHGTGGDDDLVLSGQTVMLGGVTVAGSGVEQIHLDGGSGDGDVITYNGVAGVSEDIELHAAVASDAGRLLVPGVASYFYTGVMLFEINGNDGLAGDTDTVTVKGTNGDDRFEIQMDAVGTAADPVLQLFDRDTDDPLLTLLNYSMFPTLNIDSVEGGDLFNVYTGPTLGRQIFIDAGLPEGKKRRRPADRTDELHVFYVREPRRPSITHNTETQDPDSGLIDMVYDSGVRTVVQYLNVEKVIIEAEGDDGDDGDGGNNAGGNGKGKGPK
jgi:hypothetical protein